MTYILKYKTTLNKTDTITYHRYDYAKELYSGFIYNLTIKSCKLYEIKHGRKILIESFKKNKIKALGSGK